MSDALGLIAALDRLYESVLTDPAAWDDAALGAWMDDFQSGTAPLPREWAREVRRALRSAGRLARFWSTAIRSQPADWRSAVDVALGGRGWEPTLAIARLGLEAAPSEQLYAETKRRFQVARFSRWMEGVDYEDWVGGTAPAAAEGDR